MKLSAAIRDGVQTSSAQRCRTEMQSCGFPVLLIGTSLHYVISVFAGYYFCLSLESLPSTADLVSFSFPNLLISLISLFNLTLKPLDIPCHGCSTGLHWHSCSGPPVTPAQGCCHTDPAPPPAAFWGFIFYFQFRKLF